MAPPRIGSADAPFGVPLEVPLLGAALAGVTVAVFTSKDKAASP